MQAFGPEQIMTVIKGNNSADNSSLHFILDSASFAGKGVGKQAYRAPAQLEAEADQSSPSRDPTCACWTLLPFVLLNVTSTVNLVAALSILSFEALTSYNTSVNTARVMAKEAQLLLSKRYN